MALRIGLLVFASAKLQLKIESSRVRQKEGRRFLTNTKSHNVNSRSVSHNLKVITVLQPKLTIQVQVSFANPLLLNQEQHTINCVNTGFPFRYSDDVTRVSLFLTVPRHSSPSVALG